MNELQALLASHRNAALGVAAAGVAGLALWQRKKKGTAAAGPAPAVSAGAAVPLGTLPASAVIPSSASAGNVGYDVYNGLQSELQQILAQQSLQTSAGGSVAAAVPAAPVASTLFSPTYDNQYVRFNDGTTAEVESDGSLLWLNQDQYNRAGQLAGGAIPATNLPQKAPTKIYDTGGNLVAKNS